MLQSALVSMVQIGQVPRYFVRLNEADHVADRRPGLAWRIYALVLRQISLALGSSRFFLSSARDPGSIITDRTWDARKRRSEPGEPNAQGPLPLMSSSTPTRLKHPTGRSGPSSASRHNRIPRSLSIPDYS